MDGLKIFLILSMVGVDTNAAMTGRVIFSITQLRILAFFPKTASMRLMVRIKTETDSHKANSKTSLSIIRAADPEFTENALIESLAVWGSLWFYTP